MIVQGAIQEAKEKAAEKALREEGGVEKRKERPGIRGGGKRSNASAETGGNEEEDPVAGPSLPPPAAVIAVQSNPVNASDGPEQS